jgi:hypothetical protein
METNVTINTTYDTDWAGEGAMSVVVSNPGHQQAQALLTVFLTMGTDGVL